MSRFYVIEPEVAGGLGAHTVGDFGEHPPAIERLHYKFDGWNGDELVETFPCFIATKALAQRIEAAGLTGVRFEEVEVSTSELFHEVCGPVPLPEFLWLRVTGRRAVDDFSLAEDHRLTVSQQALDVLEGSVSNAVLEKIPNRDQKWISA